MVSMVREVIDKCPDELFAPQAIGVREQVYHVLVGMDVWLHPDPSQYPFDKIVDGEAAQLNQLASDEISRAFLRGYLEDIEKKIEELLVQSRDPLEIRAFMGKEFTVLDLSLSQLRHAQHHIGVVNQMLHVHGSPIVEWRGYGE